MTPGENELARELGRLHVEKAQLLNRLQAQELAAHAERERYQALVDAYEKHLTKTGRKELGLDVE